MKSKVLTLSYPGMKSVSVSYELGDPIGGVDLCLGRVCGDMMEGLDCGDAVSEWLTEATGEEGLRLVRLHSRTATARRDTATRSLANSGQLLVLNRQSAADLAADAGGLDVQWTLNQGQYSIDLYRGFLERLPINLSKYYIRVCGSLVLRCFEGLCLLVRNTAAIHPRQVV